MLAVRDAETIVTLGKLVFDTLHGVLRDSSQYHPITVSRATFCALFLLKASYVSIENAKTPKSWPRFTKFEQEHDFVNVPVLLHAISNLSPDALGKTSDLILSGLALCVDEPGSLRSEMMTSPDFWAILRALAGKPSSAALVFGILEKGTTGSPPAIMADNYEAAIALLNGFASAANPHKLQKQRVDPRRSGSHQQRQVVRQYVMT